jgi:hypothetical protein
MIFKRPQRANPRRRLARTALCVLAAFPASVALAAHANAISDDALAEFSVVADNVLTELRGGFRGLVGGAPLQLSFGIEQALFINDALLVTTLA